MGALRNKTHFLAFIYYIHLSPGSKSFGAMKLLCLILICVLLLGYSAKALAEQNDSVLIAMGTTELRSRIEIPAPEIYSFTERVLLWENMFADRGQLLNSYDFGSRIRNDIREDGLMSLTSVCSPKEWNWKITNVKKKAKYKPSDRRLKKDFLQALWEPYDPENSVTPTYDWTLNNTNPFSRQSVRINLMNFPKLYFLIQMFSFVQIFDDFIRQIPTSYNLNEQWKISYRKEMVVFTYTY